MKKLILIDGNAILHKAYHGLPPFKTKEGELVNAVYGFASVVLNLLNDQDPDYMAATFDVKGGTFRHEQNEDYKATRKKAPDELYGQLPRIKEVLQAFQMPIYESPGFEADDLLGTLAALAEERGEIETYIVTGDLDTLQLVAPRTRVLAMHQGFSRPIVFDREAVIAKYGLTPEQIVDMKGLQGDASDNIKGVPGVGKKTAQDLLLKFGSVEGVYQNLGQIKDSLKKKLEEGRESAFQSKELATIVRDIEGVELDLLACEVRDYDAVELARMFEELEFRTLLNRLGRFQKRAEQRRKVDPAQESLF